MSDDTAMLVATLDTVGVRFTRRGTKTTRSAMAEGYAAATGRLGIAILGRGPATANASARRHRSRCAAALACC